MGFFQILSALRALLGLPVHYFLAHTMNPMFFSLTLEIEKLFSLLNPLNASVTLI